MKVRIISYSKPTKEFYEETGMETLTDLVSYCARVSNPNNQNNKETTSKLIKYLLDHKHFSPFEMVSVCIELETTRDIARQFLRHRSLAFQEFSQRYSDPTKDLSFVKREPRLQDPKNRQNSISEGVDVEVQYGWDTLQDQVIQTAKQAYDWAIKNGIAKEQARAVLPEGLTVSKLYAQGTLRSWIHYCELRAENGTQLEHQEIAKAIAKVISEIFPTKFEDIK